MTRFTLDSTGLAVASAETIDWNSALSVEPMVGTVVRDTLVYVANSPWAKYERGNRIPGTTLARPLLLALPLPH